MFLKFVGLCTIAASLVVVFFFETHSTAVGLWRVFHWPAMVLTGVGPLGLVMMCTDWQVIKKTIHLLFAMSPEALQAKHERSIQILQKVANDFYSQGAKALETLDTRSFSPLFRRMIDRLAIRMPTSDIRNLVMHERGRADMRLSSSVNMLGLGVRLAPSIGMLGTILGMVNLLATMEDPSKIGSTMSLALLTTFYGLFFSLVFWTPLQQRLERLLFAELYVYDQVLHWVELLEKRKPASYFEDATETEVPKVHPIASRQAVKQAAQK